MHLFNYDLTIWQVIAIVAAAFAAGVSKTGVIGLGVLITPLAASVFPAGLSLGFMLPLYILGDVITLTRFRRKVMWDPLLKALPWGIAGTLFGWWVARLLAATYGKEADDRLRTLIGILMAAVVVLSYYVSRHPGMARGAKSETADGTIRPGRVRRWYATVLGAFAGVLSMLTNSGGPIWGLYLSSLGLEVKEVIGTAVWCYFVVAVIKLPLSANLGFMDWNSLQFNLILAPLTVAGVLMGGMLSSRFSKETFSRITQCLAVFGAAYMILS